MARSLLFAASLLVTSRVAAQQFEDYLTAYDSFGLSDGCFEAVNTTISCPGWLVDHAGFSQASFDILPETALQVLCAGMCRNELASLKDRISKACTAKTDVMVPPGDIAYPATFLVDRYMYAADLSCLKDSASGKYCDVIVAPWSEQKEPYSKAQNCSDCSLGTQVKQLSSPFGYSPEDDSNFASTTSSCGATQYSYATPTAYAINSTTASPARPICTGESYTVQEGDSCNSVAEAKKVSTESLISENGIDIACNLFPSPGESVCLPKTCKIRELAMHDTCESIVDEEHITFSQLLAWNPIISAGCFNLNSWRGRFLCVSPPLGTVTVPDGAVITAAPVPTNKQGESVSNCGQWYTISKGDTCAAISLRYGIALADFYFLNPHVDSKSCNNLWLDTAYCVKPVGSIETYPGYTVSVPSTSFTRPPKTPTPTPTGPPIANWTDNPRAPGTREKCFSYGNAWPEAIIAGGKEFMNGCEFWATYGGVYVEQLLAWNPSLSQTNCVFRPGFSYCITKNDPRSDDEPDEPELLSSHTPTASSSSTTPTPTAGGNKPPAQTQPGTSEACTKWHVVHSGDGCWDIANKNGIDLNDFYKWNPGVGTKCEALWPDYAVCVASGNNKPPASDDNKPPAQTQPGVTASCKKWYVVQGGDGCWAIANNGHIELDDFYKWNPGVGSGCQSLWPNYAVCVGI